MLVDYVHKRKFPVLGPLATWSLRGATVAALLGIYQFNTNDIGRLHLKMIAFSAHLVLIISPRSHRIDRKSMGCLSEQQHIYTR